MERPIRHVHVRRFAAAMPEVERCVDALWSRSAQDALPRLLGGWRRCPPGAQGMAVGTRFGHGPFSFHVEHWDGRTLRARIETPGYRGQHGFTLRAEAGHVIVTHELDAQLALSRWLLWQLFIARRHDWAVEALFDRMEALLRERPTAEHSERAPPLALRAFVSVRRLIREPRAS